ncbi:MAG: HesA/MoeB/ThiF family protein [Deltaproteobacteria bacterium]|nr:HesA/MoeB/ThiF family protein [Deltaproteobacteria bacterium]
MSAENILKKQITLYAENLPDQAGRDRVIIREERALDIARTHNVGLYDIYLAAFELKIEPYRYIRNLDSITIEDQHTLARARVCVIGAGGLGGQVILLLSRLGSGNILIVDGDRFDETNLNRQALCSMDALGRPKVAIAKEEIAKINPAVNVTAYCNSLDHNNAEKIFTNSDVIIDALDNVPDRFIIESYAQRLSIPLVHGAVAGLYGQVMTIFKGDAGLECIYDKERATLPLKDNPALKLGVPAATPVIIAALQAMETVKILLKKQDILRNRLAYLDME